MTPPNEASVTLDALEKLAENAQDDAPGPWEIEPEACSCRVSIARNALRGKK